MPEILQEALKGHNLPLTILVGVVLLYWVVSMFGLVDLDSMDGGGADAADGLDGERTMAEATMVVAKTAIRKTAITTD